jgi:hypothetical protein
MSADTMMYDTTDIAGDDDARNARRGPDKTVLSRFASRAAAHYSQ